ncbi:GIY-YIG nuclease family protein [Robiginitomaculum antarcticum]|uniref:GIY-YIG nuclease family protein n=1 Tax=Robiginitomaculum antarcticum TaxID=437507 RepID=UPI00036E5E49|nr:GIY-YIG nuclease family protein [Robiginitomaculum antarcticum]
MHFADSLAYYVYMMASMKNGTLYLGMTNDLERRVWEHKNNENPKSYTARYHIHRLVYFETFDSPDTAIRREKYLKGKSRQFKIELLEMKNPHWIELYEKFMRGGNI